MTKTNPIASVIVPSFNHQTFLLNALNSIKTIHGKDVEVIIIDDCSNDLSKNIIKMWRKKNIHKFSCIETIFHSKQYGISNVVLELISSSHAKLLIPLASDDMFFPNTVDERIKFLHCNPNIWVGFSDASVLNKKGKTIEGSLYKYYNHKFSAAPCAALRKELVLNWNYPANIQFWRKGEWINEISPGMFSEDVEIALTALSKSKIKYLDKVLYQYRVADWPIKVKGCEKTKRLHLAYYYKKESKKVCGIYKKTLEVLSEYNFSLAIGDAKRVKFCEKKISFLKKIPPIFF